MPMNSLNDQEMLQRIEWRLFEESKYLFMNFQHCTDQERIDISKVAIKIISKEEFKSVKLLVDMRNTTVSIESMRAVKKDWISVKPNLDKISMIGITGSKSTMIKLWNFMTTLKVKPAKSEKEGIQFILSK